jgi:hypothetical protein
LAPSQADVTRTCARRDSDDGPTAELIDSIVGSRGTPKGDVVAAQQDAADRLSL